MGVERLTPREGNKTGRGVDILAFGAFIESP